MDPWSERPAILTISNGPPAAHPADQARPRPPIFRPLLSAKRPERPFAGREVGMTSARLDQLAGWSGGREYTTGIHRRLLRFVRWACPRRSLRNFSFGWLAMIPRLRRPRRG